MKSETAGAFARRGLAGLGESRSPLGGENAPRAGVESATGQATVLRNVRVHASGFGQ